MNERRAVITTQGNLFSGKMYDPSGYVVFSGQAPKTFRNTPGKGHNGLQAAVTWAVKNGYKPVLSAPLKPTGQFAALTVRLNNAAEAAAAAIAAEKEEAEA